MFTEEMAFFDELKDVSFWRDFVCEIICTFFLLLYITFTNVSLDTTAYQPSTFSTGVAIAFIVAALIECFGNVSGCFMNPGITFGVFLKRKISFVRWLLFTGAQLFGGFAGASTCWAITPENLRSMIKPVQPSSQISNGQAVAVEFLITFVLIYIVISTTDDSLGRPVVSHLSIPVGLTVGAGIIATGTVTGASLNPAVNFSLGAVNRDFPRQWIYWAAHYPAAVAAASLHYLFVFTKPKTEKPVPVVTDALSEIPPTESNTNGNRKEIFMTGENNLAFTTDNTIL